MIAVEAMSARSGNEYVRPNGTRSWPTRFEEAPPLVPTTAEMRNGVDSVCSVDGDLSATSVHDEKRPGGRSGDVWYEFVNESTPFTLSAHTRPKTGSVRRYRTRVTLSLVALVLSLYCLYCSTPSSGASAYEAT